MPNVVGIRFKSCGKIYDFEITGLEVRKGDRVIIDSDSVSASEHNCGCSFVEKPADLSSAYGKCRRLKRNRIMKI
jgi:hypothetical protein